MKDYINGPQQQNEVVSFTARDAINYCIIPGRIWTCRSHTSFQSQAIWLHRWTHWGLAKCKKIISIHHIQTKHEIKLDGSSKVSTSSSLELKQFFL